MTDDIDRDELYEIVIVVNGSLNMTPGKLAGQCFQAAARATRLQWPDWIGTGTRTIVRVAKTQALFDRICNEVPGFLMVDEGYTEVDAGAKTLMYTIPFKHKDRPAVIDKKTSKL